jgi:DUF971 family protein
MSRTRLRGATLDPQGGTLALVWGDGVEVTLPLAVLRRNCPCASCRDNREKAASGGLLILPPDFANASPVITELQPVGRYALQPHWKDGHSTGIYTYEYLRELCDRFGTTEQA